MADQGNRRISTSTQFVFFCIAANAATAASKARRRIASLEAVQTIT